MMFLERGGQVLKNGERGRSRQRRVVSRAAVTIARAPALQACACNPRAPRLTIAEIIQRVGHGFQNRAGVLLDLGGAHAPGGDAAEFALPSFRQGARRHLSVGCGSRRPRGGESQHQGEGECLKCPHAHPLEFRLLVFSRLPSLGEILMPVGFGGVDRIGMDDDVGGLEFGPDTRLRGDDYGVRATQRQIWI